jgi:nucleoside diphosphate kinase
LKRGLFILKSTLVKNKDLLIDKKTIIFVLKPDAVERNLLKDVLDILLSAGFEELCCVIRNLTKDDVKLLYKETFEKEYPLGVEDPRTQKHIEHMTSGSCIALLLRHKRWKKPDLYMFCRKLRGEDWIPVRCSPTSIRYRLRDTSYDKFVPEFCNGFIVSDLPHSIVHATLNDNEFINAFTVFF